MVNENPTVKCLYVHKLNKQGCLQRYELRWQCCLQEPLLAVWETAQVLHVSCIFLCEFYFLSLAETRTRSCGLQYFLSLHLYLGIQCTLFLFFCRTSLALRNTNQFRDRIQFLHFREFCASSLTELQMALCLGQSLLPEAVAAWNLDITNASRFGARNCGLDELQHVFICV